MRRLLVVAAGAALVALSAVGSADDSKHPKPQGAAKLPDGCPTSGANGRTISPDWDLHGCFTFQVTTQPSTNKDNSIHLEWNYTIGRGASATYTKVKTAGPGGKSDKKSEAHNDPDSPPPGATAVNWVVWFDHLDGKPPVEVPVYGMSGSSSTP